MSAGIRSGVHWMRRSSSPSTVPSVSTSRVLARPGTPIKQRVTAGQQGDQGLVDHLLLTEDDSRDAGANLRQPVAECLDLMGELFARVAGVELWIGHRQWGVLQTGADEDSGTAGRAMERGRMPGPTAPSLKMDTQPRADQENPEASVQTSPERRVIDCGDLHMRIARDGTWFYHGSPIGRKPLVKLFASVLRREADGSFWLVTPVERGRVEVEDAPFTAVELAVEGAGRDRVLRLRTNLDEWVDVGADRPIRLEAGDARSGPRPYVLVREGLEALISRPVFYELVALAEPKGEGGQELGVWSQGAFFPLAAVRGSG